MIRGGSWFAALATLAACSSQVVLEQARGGSGGTTASTSTASVVTAGVGGQPTVAAAQSVASSSGAGGCTNGQPTLACETCIGANIVCQPGEACAFEGAVCASCPEAKKYPIIAGAYQCNCSPGGEDLPPRLVCQRFTQCCKPGPVISCGDVVPMECAVDRCVPKPPPGKCWGSLDCFGGDCVGAFLCPCGAQCDSNDRLGKCTPPKD
jgi:hypothetical protein